MAKFNPDIPESGAPSYLGLSRPIDQFEGDKSLGMLFKGVGDIVSSGLTAADNVVKSIIDKSIYDKVDEKREAFTGTLEEMANIPPNLRVAQYQPSGEQAGATLLPSQMTVPATVEGVGDEAGTIVSAGRASPGLKTYYAGRLDLIAKDMRSQFPGYRDYIDRKIEQVTGMNPANQVMADLMQMINQQGANAQSELTKAKAYVVSRAGAMGGPNGDRPSYELMHLLDNGAYLAAKMSPMEFAMRWYNRYDTTKTANENIKQQHEANAATTADLKQSAVNSITQMAVNTQSMFWGNNKQVAGANFKNWDEFTTRVANDPSYRNSPQLIQAATVMLNQLSMYKNDVITSAQLPGEGGKPSLWVAAGGDGQAAVDRGFAQMESVLQRILNKDVGLAARSGKFTDAVISDTTSKLLSDPKIGQRVLSLAAANKYGGNQVAGALATKELASGLDSDIKATFEAHKDMLLDPSLPNFNIKAAVEDAQGKGIGNPQGNPTTGHAPRANWKAERDYYNKILTYPGSIFSNKEMSLPLKLDLANKTFTPETYGLISKFESGEAQVSAFEKLGDLNSVIKPIKQIAAQSGDPTLWAATGKWLDHEFANELFPKQLKALGTYVDTPNLKIVYNPDTSHWTAVDVRPAEMRMQSMDAFTRYRDKVQTDLDRLNRGIDVVAGYIRENGGDVNSYILKKAVDAGLDPNSAVGIPASMIKELVKSGQKKEPAK